MRIPDCVMAIAVLTYVLKTGGKYSNADPGIFRVDLHPRVKPDGRKVCFDATHEVLGRQIYLIGIGDIIDNPPS